jgi:hypothetical protein
VPSSAKRRNTVNCASTRFNQEEFVGVWAISTLFAVAQTPTWPSRLVVRCGLKLSQTIADANRWKVEGAQLAAEFQEPGPGTQPTTRPCRCVRLPVWCRYPPASVYLYFPDRDALVAAAMRSSQTA